MNLICLLIITAFILSAVECFQITRINTVSTQTLDTVHNPRALRNSRSNELNAGNAKKEDLGGMEAFIRPDPKAPTLEDMQKYATILANVTDYLDTQPDVAMTM